MRKSLLLCSIGVLLATPAMAASWVRSYVVDNYEPAFYYGGESVGTEAPGSDCPKGTIPDNDYKKLIKTPWRSDADVRKLTLPVSDGGVPHGSDKGISYRGFRPDIETYINPFAAPDPGMQQVTGKIAVGFNLDGNTKTGGFTSPDGVRGVDNAFYRAWGCLMSYRGTPYHAYLSERANDKMLDGLYTMVIRISGNADPMNDKNAIVEIAYSPDHVVRGPNGKVLPDYSFRPVKSAQYTKLKATIKNGAVRTEQADLHLPAFSWGETNRGDALFQKGKVSLKINADGTLAGVAGGYRDWRDIYARDTFNSPSDGTTRETYYHENQIGMYYALKRNADGVPDPKTGQNTAISAAYRFTARPAYVVDPESPAAVNEPPYPTGGRTVIRRGLFMKAQLTKAISPYAWRTRHKTNAADYAAPKPAPAKAPTGGLQVDNGAPATVASAAR